MNDSDQLVVEYREGRTMRLRRQKYRRILRHGEKVSKTLNFRILFKTDCMRRLKNGISSAAALLNKKTKEILSIHYQHNVLRGRILRPKTGGRDIKGRIKDKESAY